MPISDEARQALEQGNIELFINRVAAENSFHDGFAEAAERGSLEALEGLLARVPEEQHQAMIHQAFLLAAQNGHLNVVNRLIELTPDPEQRQEANDFAFLSAAQNGHLDVVNRLIELNPDQEQRQEINDFAFCFAAENGHLEVANYLLESTPINEVNPQTGLNRRQEMVNMFIDRGEEMSYNSRMFFAVIAERDWPQFNLNPTDQGRLEELRNLRGELIGRLSERPEVLGGLSSENAANRVMAELFNNNQKRLIGFERRVTFERSTSRRGLPAEMVNEIFSFENDISFSDRIPHAHREIAIAGLRSMLFPQPNPEVTPLGATQSSGPDHRTRS